jgi:hypothetical protein
MLLGAHGFDVWQRDLVGEVDAVLFEAFSPWPVAALDVQITAQSGEQ